MKKTKGGVIGLGTAAQIIHLPLLILKEADRLVDQAASLAKTARVEISLIEREQASGREEIVTPYVVKSDLNSELDRASEFILA